MCLRGDVDEALQQRGVRELDVAVDRGGVRQRVQDRAVALEHGDDALERLAEPAGPPGPAPSNQRSDIAHISAPRRSTTRRTRWWRSRK